jgi:hypothetical protein
MARIRTKPGFGQFFRLCTDGIWRLITPQWQEMDDGLITDGMRKRHDIEIEPNPFVGTVQEIVLPPEAEMVTMTTTLDEEPHPAPIEAPATPTDEPPPVPKKKHRTRKSR